MLRLLALNAGIEADVARQDDIVGNEHAWTIAKIDGDWYHFDACWQSAIGQGLDYFGLSDDLEKNNLRSLSEDYYPEIVIKSDNYFDNDTSQHSCLKSISQEKYDELYRNIVLNEESTS